MKKRTTTFKKKHRATIAILYHKIDEQKDGVYLTQEFATSDKQTEDTAKFIKSILTRRRYKVQMLTISPDDLSQLQHFQADYVFNLVDSKMMEIKIARILDRLQIKHSGSLLEAIKTSNNKIRSKKVFEQHGLPIPKYTVIPLGTRVSKKLLPSKFPIIVKPAFEHCSIGIGDNSIVTSYQQFKKVVAKQRRLYKQTLLAEEFIEGKEFHVTVFEEGHQTTALPIAQLAFKRGIRNKWNIYGFDEKWRDDLPIYKSSHFVSPPKKLHPGIDLQIKQDSIRGFYAFGFQDYARFDLRFNPKNKKWYFLEANANAGITPNDPTDAMNASIIAHGSTLNDFIVQIVRNTLQ